MTDKQIITKSQMIMRIAELSANLIAKEQECEFSNLKIIQLQETLSQYETDLSTKDCIVETCKAQYKELKLENKHLNDLLNQALKELEKTREILTEIKEIAEKIDDSGGCAYGDYDCDNCSSLEQETVCTYKVKKLILQKISECEGK